MTARSPSARCAPRRSPPSRPHPTSCSGTWAPAAAPSPSNGCARRAAARPSPSNSNAERLAMIATNADALGTPRLKIIAGEAPATFAGQPAPDAVFIGGGIWIPGVFENAWEALKPGGTMVANVVTIEGELHLYDLHEKHGGDTRPHGYLASHTCRPAPRPSPAHGRDAMAGAEAMVKTGTLYGVGVGPGDPELMTREGLAAHLHCARHRLSRGQREGLHRPRHRQPLHPRRSPCTSSSTCPCASSASPARGPMIRAPPPLPTDLDAGPRRGHALRGRSLLLWQLHVSLRAAGRSPILASWCPASPRSPPPPHRLRRPLSARNEVVKVLPATLPEDRLREELMTAESAAIIKVGRHLPKIRTILGLLDLASKAHVIVKATHEDEASRLSSTSRKTTCPTSPPSSSIRAANHGEARPSSCSAPPPCRWRRQAEGAAWRRNPHARLRGGRRRHLCQGHRASGPALRARPQHHRPLRQRHPHPRHRPPSQGQAQRAAGDRRGGGRLLRRSAARRPPWRQ